MTRQFTSGLLALTGFVALLLPACSESSEPPDAAMDTGTPRDVAPPRDTTLPDAGPRCILNAECDDGVYCNGPEVCEPTNSRADDFGCVAGDDPCIDGLLCTVEPDPACDEGAHTCAPPTYDHSVCPDGHYCLVFAGCTDVEPCPADGSACPDDGGDPCTVPTCDTELDPPLCIPTAVAEDTPCTSEAGAMGICRAGECRTDL